MAVTLLSRRAYAASRDVSEGAVRKQIKAGRIVPTPDGKIDPAQADAGWYRWSPVSVRGKGQAPKVDSFVEVTYPATSGTAPARRPSSSRKDEDSFDDRWLAEQLARLPAEPDAAGDRWLDEQMRQLQPNERTLDRLEEIKRLVVALRREFAAAPSRGYGTAELHRGFAGIEIKLNVCFHQLSRLICGEELTVKQGVFGDDPLPLPAGTLRSPPGARSAAGREMIATPGFPASTALPAVSERGQEGRLLVAKIEALTERLAAIAGDGEDSRATTARIEAATTATCDPLPGLARTETALLALERQGRDTLAAIERVGHHLGELVKLLIARVESV
jgi:hypothetical protein